MSIAPGGSLLAGSEDGYESDELSLSEKIKLLEDISIRATLLGGFTKKRKQDACDNCGAMTHESKACEEGHGKDLAFVASCKAREKYRRSRIKRAKGNGGGDAELMVNADLDVFSMKFN